MKLYEAVFLTKISPKQDFNRNRAYFFLFCDLNFIDYLVTFGGIHAYFWQQNLKTIGRIHETRKKKIETFRSAGWALGPPLRPSGPADRPKSFNLFFCRVS